MCNTGAVLIRVTRTDSTANQLKTLQLAWLQNITNAVTNKAKSKHHSIDTPMASKFGSHQLPYLEPLFLLVQAGIDEATDEACNVFGGDLSNLAIAVSNS